MSKKENYYDFDNALFVLSQLNDTLQKGGLTTFIESINELKLGLTKLEGEIQHIKETLTDMKESKKDRRFRLLTIIVTPLVMITIALVGHWYMVENSIHKLNSRIEVLKSVIDERDKKYEIKFLNRDEYLRDIRRRKDENNSTSRR